jgi:hypothetical protein
MSQENIARADLRPVTTSQLKGRSSQRGKLLTVTDPNGDAVVQAVLAKAVKPAYAVFKAADGEWRVEQTGRHELVVLDPSARASARVRTGEVVLANRETLTWHKPSHVRPRYRLGGDLWVAKPSRLPVRRFNAKLSQAMLARDDRGLLVGIASILTLHVVQLRARWWWIPSGGA